jgi:integrase
VPTPATLSSADAACSGHAAQQRLTIDTKIKPGLGHLAVTKVDARVLDRFYAALRKGGNARSGGRVPSAGRVRDVHAILSGTLGLAARWNYIPFNPAVLARPPGLASQSRRGQGAPGS